jgi:hypothetical protein
VAPTTDSLLEGCIEGLDGGGQARLESRPAAPAGSSFGPLLTQDPPRSAEITYPGEACPQARARKADPSFQTALLRGHRVDPVDDGEPTQGPHIRSPQARSGPRAPSRRSGPAGTGTGRMGTAWQTASLLGPDDHLRRARLGRPPLRSGQSPGSEEAVGGRVPKRLGIRPRSNAFHPAGQPVGCGSHRAHRDCHVVACSLVNTRAEVPLGDDAVHLSPGPRVATRGDDTPPGLQEYLTWQLVLPKAVDTPIPDEHTKAAFWFRGASLPIREA